MTLLPRGHVLCCFLAVGFLLSAAGIGYGQTYASCRGFSEALAKNNLHAKIDCLEAWFSEDPAHLTFSGMPPGNGMALGGVLEQNNHYVSPFSLPAGPGNLPGLMNPQPPDFTTGKLPSVAEGSLWSADGRLAATFSTNGSWATMGALTVMPKGYKDGHRTDHAGVQISCNKLGPLCTKQIFGLHFDASHRSLQTLSFYGVGPDSPAVKYVFHENDTFASIRAALPLADWFTFELGAEFRLTDVPRTTVSNSVSTNFTDATAPGLSSQPGFGHYHLALRTSPIAILSPRTDDQDDNHSGPLMKPYVQFTFNNSVEYHWYSAPGNSASSFQQLVEDSDENIQLGTRVRHYVEVGDAKTGAEHFWDSILAKTCGDKNIDWSKPGNYVLKVRQPCGFGDLDLVSHIVASRTGSDSTVPFYLQPTVGGSDIDSRLSLRAWPDYRFRGPDALFFQTNYILPLYNILVFYDAGTVGPSFSSLSAGGLRQDAGIGVALSLAGHIAAEGYLAMGAGHGPTFGYNFSRLF
ncbi:MAG TPA: hypothetical protein VHX37_07815 [Acidobacteriaceae bacterium]|jgi:hypothetical protein|nr:hypothetical protein [Acidobacteriaceae bacterium]